MKYEKISTAKLIAMVAKDTGVSNKEVTVVVNSFIKQMSTALSDKKSISFTNLGVLAVLDTNEYRRKIPRTGEMVTIPSGQRIKFKPSTKFCFNKQI